MDQAAAGSFIIPSSAVLTTVQTSTVRAESQIFLTKDSSIGAKLGVTCGTRAGLTFDINGHREGPALLLPRVLRPVIILYAFLAVFST